MHQQLPSIGPIHGQLAAPVPPDRHELAEEMAWVHLYRAVRQPPGAAEVVKYLNSNPEARSRHEALYLIACETLHAKALADEQSERTVAAFRAIFVTAPISVLQLATAIVVAIPRIFSSKSTGEPKASGPRSAPRVPRRAWTCSRSIPRSPRCSPGSPHRRARRRRHRKRQLPPRLLPHAAARQRDTSLSMSHARISYSRDSSA
jgi:uncharacterized protein (DUF2132 family)